MADTAKKRKQAPGPGPTAKRPRFPQKSIYPIAVMATRAAYPQGEINVKSFLSSRENEIKSLERAIQVAKKGLARRAFQDVPREMRRRTASHNPQRVPKRLRMRATKEARNDNTPISKGKSGSGTGKGKQKYLRKEGRERSRKDWEQRAKTRKDKHVQARSEKDEDGDSHMGNAATIVAKPAAPLKTKRKFPALATPATPPSRFRRRQQNKTWLPTHVWHTKRAQMTNPKEPLWRFVVALQPVLKAYRLTHRAATERGAVAWDMSYMSTISLEGPENSITGALKGLQFSADSGDDPWQDRGRSKKWRHGTRTWEGWICEREARPSRKISRVTVIWCIQEPGNEKRKAFIRVHPSAFLQLWNEVIRIAKTQKPAVVVQDLRFEIGSVEITGPAAAEALCSILSPASTDVLENSPQSVWPKLAPVTNAASLPAGALLAFNVSDPRLQDPPATTPLPQDQQTLNLNSLIEILAAWPVDETQTAPSIFDGAARSAAARSVSSQKSINRRKSSCTLGQIPEVRPADPQIPMLLYTSRESRSWTVLLPWKWVMPVWRGIMRYPTSTGGTPRFGGLKERRQVSFEQSLPQFPYDYPGTDSGRTWEMREREARKHEWTKRPKGKRIEWSTIDLGKGRKGEIGDPWANDWERLLPASVEAATAPPGAKKEAPRFRQLSSSQAAALVEGKCSAIVSLTVPYLYTVKITMAQRGTPPDCARIYRLPTNDQELRSKWLSLLPVSGSNRVVVKEQRQPSNNALEHVQRREQARRLLEPPRLVDGPPKAGADDYPIVPDEDDLIGFVTTGNYNLSEGLPTAVANLVLHRVLDAKSQGGAVPKEDRICIVRQAGSTIGRLATWNVV